MPGVRRKIWSYGARGRRAKAPERKILGVVKQRTAELDGFEDFGKDIHVCSTGEARTVGILSDVRASDVELSASSVKRARLPDKTATSQLSYNATGRCSGALNHSPIRSHRKEGNMTHSASSPEVDA
jgi:hypothetical protein